MMSGAAACIEHAPARARRRRTRTRHMRCDGSSDRIEVPGLEKSRSMVELLRAIAAGDQAAATAVEQIDVPIAREVEAVPIAANEKAGRADEIKTADGAAQQSMAGAGQARRHGAAPSSSAA
jgi:hypothetical protein